MLTRYIILTTLSSIALASDHSHSFVDVDPDLHRIRRNLLQEDTISDVSDSIDEEEKAETEPPPVVYKGLATPEVPELSLIHI